MMQCCRLKEVLVHKDQLCCLQGCKKHEDLRAPVHLRAIAVRFGSLVESQI